MAAKKPAAKAPAANTRVSPGVYRDAKGNLTNSSKGVGITAKPPEKKAAAKKVKAQALPGLTAGQNQIINQRQDADIDLGGIANNQLDQINQNFQQPFNWGALPDAPTAPNYDNIPQAPVTGDFNQWRTDQLGKATAEFENRYAPVFKQQMEDLEQERYQKGWSQDTPAYQAKLKQVTQGQNDARQSNQVAAESQAGQTAGQFFDIGSQAHANAFNEQGARYDRGNQVYQDAYGRMQTQRNQPLADFNALYGSTSGMGTQNLGYSQQKDLQTQGEKNQRWMMQHTPRGGGGGGGGGGGSPQIWEKYGYSSPQEYDAYKVAQDRANQQWNWQNNPQYRQQSGPSAGAGLLGQALGTGLGLIGQSFF